MAGRAASTRVLARGAVGADGRRGVRRFDRGGRVRTSSWESLHRPLPAEVIEHAIACAQHRIAATGCDAIAIWEWGVVERVSTGLLLTSIGLEPVAGEMLAAACEVTLNGR